MRTVITFAVYALWWGGMTYLWLTLRKEGPDEGA